MESERPNILLIMTDQMRPDSLGCYGNPVAITPNIDGLAKRGVVFDACYVQNPLCCPSRYSILTGRYPHCHGVLSNWYGPRPGETSFAHQLSRVGYRTGAIGKMHLTPWHDTFGFGGRIIAESKFHVDCPDDYERFLNIHGTSRSRMYDFGSEQYIRNCTAVKSKLPQELHIDAFVGRSNCEYLGQIPEPFCLFTSFLGPHNPYDPPSPYDELFVDKELPPRNMGNDEVRRKPREAYDYINRRLNWPFKTDELTDEQLQITKAYYYANNTLIDDWIGQMVQVIRDRGLYDNTVVIFTSDHGDMLGDHGLVYKQCFYEQCVRAPLIVSSPRFKPGRTEALVESIDLFNTICELAGAWPGEGRQGRSLVSLLADGDARRVHRSSVFSENYFGRMVRHKDHKMVYYPGKPYGELYDLRNDPLEQENLWDALKETPVAHQLRSHLLEWSFASEDALHSPVRPDHYDASPRRMLMLDGHTAENPKQGWQFDGMEGLYKTWEFSADGVLR